MKKKTGENLLVAKAFNGRVIVSWLAHCLQDSLQSHPDHEILLLSAAAMSLDLIVPCACYIPGRDHRG